MELFEPPNAEISKGKGEPQIFEQGISNRRIEEHTGRKQRVDALKR
jgi:hypothetical protein